MQAQLRVRDLIDQDSGCWDVQQLVNLFDNTTCMNILGMIRPPGTEHVQGVQGQDMLIFSLTSNGAYSVKKAYEHLRGPGVNVSTSTSKLWHDIWKKGFLQPRIRLFLWKLSHKALPLLGILAARGIMVDPMCPTCG